MKKKKDRAASLGYIGPANQGQPVSTEGTSGPTHRTTSGDEPLPTLSLTNCHKNNLLILIINKKGRQQKYI